MCRFVAKMCVCSLYLATATNAAEETTHGISVSDLEACAREQGVTFRRSDILILRVGFIQRYNSASQAERNGLAGKPETLYVCTFAVMSVWLTDVY